MDLRQLLIYSEEGQIYLKVVNNFNLPQLGSKFKLGISFYIFGLMIFIARPPLFIFEFF